MNREAFRIFMLATRVPNGLNCIHDLIILCLFLFSFYDVRIVFIFVYILCLLYVFLYST